jgi:hypothetical protein
MRTRRAVGTRQPADHHYHRVTGEQFRVCEDDEGEGDSKEGSHQRLRRRRRHRLERRPDHENGDDARPHVRTGERGQNEVLPRALAKQGSLRARNC